TLFRSVLPALHRKHPVHPPDRLHHFLQMRQVLHLDHEAPRHPALDRLDLRRLDVRARLRDRRRNVGQQAPTVRPFHRQPYEEPVPGLRLPLDLHPPTRVVRQVQDVRAVHPVDGDAPPPRDVPDDLVSRHRLAALRVPNHQVLQTLDPDPARRPAHPVHQPLERRCRPRRRSPALVRVQRLQHGRRTQIPTPQRGQHVVEVRHRERRRSSLHLLLGRTLPPRLLQLTVEQLPPQRHRGLEFLLSDPLPDLLTRPRRLHERQPVPRRALTLVRDDLDRVPVLQLPRQRRDPAVHLRTRTVQSDLRVHREREVDRRRPLRQLLHVPPRREDEDLVLEQVDPKELHELLGLLRLLLPLQDLPEPRQRLIDVARRRPVPFLVPPVRRDTVLRGPVHFYRLALALVTPPAR